MPAAVIVLAGVNVCIGLGYGIAAPVIPLLASAFDVSDLAASGVVSAYALARILAAPVASRVSTRVAVAPLMAAAMAVTAVTSALGGLAGSLVGLLAWRALGGAATVFTSVAGQTLLYRVAPLSGRGRATALFHAGFLGGGLAGPLVGGLIAEISLAAPLLTYGGLIGVGGVLAAVLLRGHGPLAGVDGASVVAPMVLREAWADPRYTVAVVTQFANAWVGNGLRFTVVPLFVAAVLHRSPFWTGAGLLLAGATQMLLSPFAGRLVDRRGRHGPLLVGSIVTGAAAIVLALDESMAGFLGAMVLWGVAGALTTVAGGALLADVLDGRGGQPIAGYQIAFDVAGVLAPLVSGALVGAFSYAVAFSTGAAVAALGAITIIVSLGVRQVRQRRLRRTAHEPRVPAPRPGARAPRRG